MPVSDAAEPRPRRKRFKPTIRALALVAVGAAVLIVFSCRDSRRITEDQLAALPLDELVPVSTLVPEKYDVICLLRPYRNQVGGQGDHVAMVNRFLRESKYEGYESRWSIAYVKGSSVEIDLYNQSRVAYVSRSWQAVPASKLPVGFRVADCANVNEARFVQLAGRSGTYLMFGVVD